MKSKIHNDLPVLSVVFSFRNESKNIPEFWGRLKTTLEGINFQNFEAIFVNDASSDDSELIVQNLAK